MHEASTFLRADGLQGMTQLLRPARPHLDKHDGRLTPIVARDQVELSAAADRVGRDDFQAVALQVGRGERFSAQA